MVSSSCLLDLLSDVVKGSFALITLGLKSLLQPAQARLLTFFVKMLLTLIRLENTQLRYFKDIHDIDHV